MKLKEALSVAKEKQLLPKEYKTQSWASLAVKLGLKKNTPGYSCMAVREYLTTGNKVEYDNKQERRIKRLEKKMAKKIAREPRESLYIENKINRGDFYKSKEWRELRYLVLSHYKNTCMCCGASPPDVVLHVDHIKPISLFPKLCLVFDNLQILCAECNLGKSNLDMKDFREAKFLKNT